MNRHILCLLGMALLGWPAVGAAQPADPSTRRYLDPSNGLSLSEAVTRALAQEPGLRAGRSEVDAAKSLQVQAGLRLNPAVQFEMRQVPGATDSQSMAQLQWPLDLGRRAPRMEVAAREVDVAEHVLDDRRRHLAADVRFQYGRAAAAIRDVIVTESLLNAQRRLAELLRQEVGEGARPPLERDRVEVQVRRTEAEWALAVGRADASMTTLAQTIGLTDVRGLRIRDSLEGLLPPAPTAPLAPPSSAELSGRADVREAEGRVGLADARIAMARQEGTGDVTLFGGYMRMDMGFHQPNMGLDAHGIPQAGSTPIRGVFNYIGGGAMITLPWRNRNQGEVAAARAAREGAVSQLEAKRLAASAEVVSAGAQAQQARRAVGLMMDAVRLQQRNLDVTRQTYELGSATLTDVLAEQREYWEAERALTQTLSAAFESETLLQRAKGEQ